MIGLTGYFNVVRRVQIVPDSFKLLNSMQPVRLFFHTKWFLFSAAQTGSLESSVSQVGVISLFCKTGKDGYIHLSEEDFLI